MIFMFLRQLAGAFASQYGEETPIANRTCDVELFCNLSRLIQKLFRHHALAFENTSTKQVSNRRACVVSSRR